MKLMAYSLFDTKARIYAAPFFVSNRSIALRSFSDLSNDRNTTVYRHPSDFVLFEIGEYDDSNGVMTSVAPENLGNAAQFSVSHKLNGNDISMAELAAS